MNEAVLQGRRIQPHDSLMVLLNTGIGYESVLNANDKQLGKMIRQNGTRWNEITIKLYSSMIC
jgi:hypothetical protein